MLKTGEDESTFEFHLPNLPFDPTKLFYNFAGPGTHIYQRIKDHVMPINRMDAAALIHDIEYLGLPQWIADQNAIKNAGPIYGKLMKAAFAVKDVVGYDIKLQPELYEHLREIVSNDPGYREIFNKYGIEFAEGAPNLSNGDNVLIPQQPAR